MRKERPYPLRLENEQEKLIAQIMAVTGLTKAAIIRMAVDVGLENIDWDKIKKIPLRTPIQYPASVSRHLSMNETADETPAPNSPQEIATGIIEAAIKKVRRPKGGGTP